jgi:RNA polymerase sigma-70 factor (ECF subfamily)
MLGSLSEAEDIVQEPYLRWHAVERDRVDNPRADLSRAVARLCLDHLKSTRVRRASVVVGLLPEFPPGRAAIRRAGPGTRTISSSRHVR